MRKRFMLLIVAIMVVGWCSACMGGDKLADPATEPSKIVESDMEADLETGPEVVPATDHEADQGTDLQDDLEADLPVMASLTFYDTDTDESHTVQAPEAQVVKLMDMDEQESHAVALFADGAIHLYFPDEDKWVVNPLQIVDPDHDGQLLTADQEAARWMLPLRFSPFFTDDHLIYLSLDAGLFQLDWRTGRAEQIWHEPGSVYGMAVSPDGKRAALLLDQNGNIGADVELAIVKLADGTIEVQRKYAALVSKSDGFHAHMDITWLDADTLGYESWAVVLEDDGTGWRRGLFAWEIKTDTLAFVPVPDETRRFYFASDLSSYVIETHETREVVLLHNEGGGVPLLPTETAEPDESQIAIMPDRLLRIPTVAGKEVADFNTDAGNGRKLGNGILLGWMKDRQVVWYQNARNKTIEDLFF